MTDRSVSLSANWRRAQKYAARLLNELTSYHPQPGQDKTKLVSGSFVNGRWLHGTETDQEPIFSPATGEVIGTFSETPISEIDRAFKLARQSQFRWQHFVSAFEKRHTFELIVDMLRSYADDLAMLFTLESGKIFTNSHADIIECIHTVEAALRTMHDDAGTFAPAQASNKFAGTQPRPHVYFAIKPFNFIAIYWWKVAAAVMGGGAVVIKEAEQIPYTAMCMTAIFHKALDSALGVERAEGLRGLVQLLQGHGESVGVYAVELGDYDHLSATGSVKMGSATASVAASRIKPQHLELSGHNRALVWHDYPVEKAASEICLGAFGDAGQRCVSTKAAFVPKAMHLEVLAAVMINAKSLRIGDPLDPTTDLGPIISKQQLESIDAAVQDAIKSGNPPVLGGYKLCPETVDRALADGFNFSPEDFREGGKFANGYWYVPTIFSFLPFYHPIMRQEVFGPVLVLNELERSHSSRRVFDLDAERDSWIQEYIRHKQLALLPDAELFLQGVHLVNDNLYGLSSALLSYDMRYIGIFLQLAESGLIYCGRGTTGAEVDDRTIFGGMKNSGYGREGGSVANTQSRVQFYIDFHGTTRLAQRD